MSDESKFKIRAGQVWRLQVGDKVLEGVLVPVGGRASFDPSQNNPNASYEARISGPVAEWIADINWGLVGSSARPKDLLKQTRKWSPLPDGEAEWEFCGIRMTKSQVEELLLEMGPHCHDKSAECVFNPWKDQP
jgi:hypothetical protein